MVTMAGPWMTVLVVEGLGVVHRGVHGSVDLHEVDLPGADRAWAWSCRRP